MNNMQLKYFALKMLNETLFDSDDSTSSDEDLSIVTKKERETIIKIKGYVENIVHLYGNKTFQEHFRMRRDIAYNLIARLEASQYISKYKCGRENISSEKAFLLTLWYFSNKESFRQISDRFDVSLNSGHRSLLRVIKFILSLTYEYIKWSNKEEAIIISNNFKKKQGIEGIVGAIDGCHVQINRPRKDQDSYINRKGFHSIVIQGVVDTRKVFLDVSCGQPGSLHDVRVLRKSALATKAEDPDGLGNMFLIDDSAYPSLEWLVPPFKDNGALNDSN